ncbi:hypothetical protein BDY19DRAFT_913829, partial [Irpex rosettiformis]
WQHSLVLALSPILHLAPNFTGVASAQPSGRAYMSARQHLNKIAYMLSAIGIACICYGIITAVFLFRRMNLCYSMAAGEGD